MIASEPLRGFANVSATMLLNGALLQDRDEKHLRWFMYDAASVKDSGYLGCLSSDILFTYLSSARPSSLPLLLDRFHP